MDAIILAAGRGQRMGALTDNRPKCLSVLAGRTLLAWQLDALRLAGVGRVTLIGGYRSELLAGCADELRVHPRWAETNMLGTLLNAADLLEAAPTLVCYSDIVYRPELVCTLAAHPGDMVIAADMLWRGLWEARFPDPLADAETFAARDGVLVDIGRRPTDFSQIQGQYMGLMKFTPRGWGRVRAALDELEPQAVDRLDMTALFGRLLARGETVGVAPVQGGWCEVDNPDDLALYGRMAGPEGAVRGWRHDWRPAGAGFGAEGAA